MAYRDFKDLARRTTSDKVLRDKAFSIAKHPKYDGYAWVVLLKYKKGVTTVNAFQKLFDDSKRKPKQNDLEMYSTHNEGKAVVAERFIRTLETRIYKCVTSIQKIVYIDKLNNTLDDTMIHIEQLK